MSNVDISFIVDSTADVLHDGGVIAYPTEYCFGLGCDPRNKNAVEKLLQIKRRQAEQGVILIAGNLSQIDEYAALEHISNKGAIINSWPGPNTWLLPARASVPDYIKGKHTSIAMRIPQHDFCLKLLETFGHPIVSTSANRSGEPEHLHFKSVINDIGEECDLIVQLSVGGSAQASTIRDAITGETIR